MKKSENNERLVRSQESAQFNKEADIEKFFSSMEEKKINVMENKHLIETVIHSYGNVKIKVVQ